MSRITFGSALALVVIAGGCLSNTSSSGDGGSGGNEDGSTSSSGIGTSSGGGSTSSGGSSSGTTTSSSSSGSAGEGGGGSSSGGVTGTGVAITPDTGGYVAPISNSLNIQGAWYGYGDCWGSNGAPPGDCVMKGGHPASACSSITFPMPATASDGGFVTPPFTQTTPGTMCLSGTAAMVIGTDYSNMFGIGIGLDFNNVGGVKMPYAAATNKVIGFSFHLSGVPTGGIHVEFPTTDTAANGSDSYAISAASDGDYIADLTTMTDPHKLSPTFSPAPATQPAFVANNLQSVQFHVVSTKTAAITVTNLCVSNFKAIVGP
jgi:hypothetical protein